MENSRNKQFIRFTLGTILSSFMNSLPHPTLSWDVNHPFAQRIHNPQVTCLPISHLAVALPSITSTVVVLQCLCPCNHYFWPQSRREMMLAIQIFSYCKKFFYHTYDKIKFYHRYECTGKNSINIQVHLGLQASTQGLELSWQRRGEGENHCTSFAYCLKFSKIESKE